ncbi:MAG: succinate dehydrogenase, hydrophobic membrane anchor protein [Pelagibacteraceae bacterium]|nr:succinate dehydrogenase, hydrophobic membrane anchor protein [Pelagibacteraceae bacterium]
MKASRKWIIQRATALLMIPIMGWFVINFISIYDEGYFEVMNFFSSDKSKVRIPILIIISFIHIILGLKEVYQDYIQDEKIKNTANKITNVLGVTIPAITIFILFNLNI